MIIAIFFFLNLIFGWLANTSQQITKIKKHFFFNFNKPHTFWVVPKKKALTKY